MSNVHQSSGICNSKHFASGVDFSLSLWPRCVDTTPPDHRFRFTSSYRSLSRGLRIWLELCAVWTLGGFAIVPPIQPQSRLQCRSELCWLQQHSRVSQVSPEITRLRIMTKSNKFYMFLSISLSLSLSLVLSLFYIPQKHAKALSTA